MSDNLVSLRGYARLHDVNPGVMAKRKAKGQLVMVGDKVDVIASNARWAETRDPAKDYMQDVNDAQRAAHAKPPAGLVREAFDHSMVQPRETPQPGSLFQKAKTQSQVFDAKLSELKYQREVGKVIDREEVKRDIEQLASIIAKGLTGIPARVMPLINGEPDAGKRESMLEEQIRQVLTDFAEAAEKLMGAADA